MKEIFGSPVLQEIFYKEWKDKGLNVSVLREDLAHPYISGNKWRKLKYNLIDFRNSGKNTLLTFGGAFSNHLVATAAASKEYGFGSVGIVRGEEVKNPYLNFVKNCGMKLHFVTRDDYRNKNEEEYISRLLNELELTNIIGDKNEVFIIPEGGANDAAAKGASEILDDIKEDFDYVACACGTGTTIAGISRKLLSHQNAIGISVLKAENYFERQIEKFGGKLNQVILKYDYHMGGYAKSTKALNDFCKKFSGETIIPLEPVYTGKLFFGIDDLIRKNYFKTGTKVTLIHTGGIYDFSEKKI